MIESTERPTTSAKPWAALCVLAILVGNFYVYQAAFPGDFVYDDIAEVAGNYRMGDLTKLAEASWQGVKLPARPLAYASFSLNQAVLGEWPSRYLGVNLLIHFATCLLLLRLLWLLTHSTEREPQTPIRILPLGALVLCWAVHPLNVAAVAYIYQRMESLMACLFLAATIQVVHYLGRPSWWRLVFAAIFATLSALSKEVASVLPLIPFLLLPCAVGTWKERVKRAAIVAIALSITWLAIASYHIPQRELFQAAAIGNATPWHYFLTEVSVIQHYLQSAVWPQRLSVAYDWPTVTNVVQVAVPMCGIIAFGLVGAYAVARKQLWGTGLIWYLLVLAPTSSVLPLTWPAEDYRNYLPLVGLVIVLAAMLCSGERLFERWNSTFNLATTVLLIAAMLPLAQAGRNRAKLYQSRLAVWDQAAESGRAAYTAANLLSTVYIEMKDYARAEQYARQALQSDPSKTGGWSSLAGALTHQGKDDEALALLDEAVKSAKDDGRLAFARGNLLAKSDKVAAIAELERSLELDASNESAWNNLGILLARDPATFDRAQKCYERSLSVRFNNRSAFQNLAALQIKAGKLYDARSVYLTAQSIFRNDRDLQARLATVEKLIRQQELQRAKQK